ncbi:MAG: transglycosylase, partial [Verrucomicrobiales bacterium]|nr:transglycosylase [Verrucomicrobiales bacterium]
MLFWKVKIPRLAPSWKKPRTWLPAGAALALTFWFLLPWLMPWPRTLSQGMPEGVVITDRHGTPLRRLMAGGHRVGDPLKIADLPAGLIQATLAAEDRRFFSHGGVDFSAMIRAARDGAAARRRVSGASTITQQLVKLAIPRERTLTTKLKEILTARRLEMTWSKEQILEQYFARLDYGNLHRGPGAAAWGYFGKPLGDCSLAEFAFLAGLPQAPSRLNPWRKPAAAVKRQQWILERLRINGTVESAAVDRALTEPLKLRRHYGSFAAPHFAGLLIQSQTDQNLPFPTAGDWRTSLDLNLQSICERSVADRLGRLAGRHVSQAAVVVLDNATGEVRAMVGSRDFSGAGSGQVNGALARRSPGSALKPFTYLLALQRDLSPASMLADLPVEYMTATGLYRPQNYHHRSAGPVSLRTALANSLNLSAVKVLESHGGPAALVASLQSAGLTTLTKPAADYGLGLTIGGGEVTLLELTSAYSTLARLGRMISPRLTPREIDPPSAVPTPPPSPGSGGNDPVFLSGQQLYDPDACWLLADILSDNQARARTFGTDSALRLPLRCAVKTGTSTDYRDNWTIGYNPRFTVGVWVGNFDNSPMRGVSGVTGAAPIFRDIFTWLDGRYPSGWYPQPPSIVDCAVDPLTGFPVPEKWRDKRPAVVEKFRRDLLPGPADATRYDESGRVR